MPLYNVLHKITLCNYIKLQKTLPRATVGLIVAHKSLVSSFASETSCIYTDYIFSPSYPACEIQVWREIHAAIQIQMHFSKT